jgi:hypothetical protein
MFAKLFRSMAPRKINPVGASFAAADPGHGVFNYWICEKCGQTTIGKHEHGGVTPFFLACRATKGCDGMATSRFYRVSQDVKQKPHVIWYRVFSVEQFDQAMVGYEKASVRWFWEHHQNGGCLLRETEISSRYGQKQEP